MAYCIRQHEDRRSASTLVVSEQDRATKCDLLGNIHVSEGKSTVLRYTAVQGSCPRIVVRVFWQLYMHAPYLIELTGRQAKSRFDS